MLYVLIDIKTTGWSGTGSAVKVIQSDKLELMNTPYRTDPGTWNKFKLNDKHIVYLLPGQVMEAMLYKITEERTTGWCPDNKDGATSIEVRITDKLILLITPFKTDLREMNKFQMNDKEIVYLRPNQVIKIN